MKFSHYTNICESGDTYLASPKFIHLFAINNRYADIYFVVIVIKVIQINSENIAYS